MSDYILEIAQVLDREIATLNEQLEALREKRAAVIALLQDDKKSGTEFTSSKATIPLSTRQTPTRVGKALTVHERLLLALDQMSASGFETSELLAAINSDGNGGEVNRNSTLKIFKNLISKGTIDVVTPWSGKRGGVYKKSTKAQQLHGEVQSQNDEPIHPAPPERVEQHGEQEHKLF